MYVSQEEQLITGHINQKVESCFQAMHGGMRYMASTDKYSYEMEKDAHKEQERKEAPWVLFLEKDSFFRLPH